MGFQYWLKKRKTKRMPDRKRKRVPDHRSDVLKISLPPRYFCPSRNSEYPRLNEESEKE